jgi:hypothetical protein
LWHYSGVRLTKNGELLILSESSFPRSATKVSNKLKPLATILYKYSMKNHNAIISIDFRNQMFSNGI